MTGNEASAYLLAQHGIRRKPATLATLRSRGGGPPFRKAGRDVIYEPADLDGWAAKAKSGPLASTSQARICGAAAGGDQ
jgi:hypothetical protein